jgi:hypothetical protein
MPRLCGSRMYLCRKLADHGARAYCQRLDSIPNPNKAESITAGHLATALLLVVWLATPAAAANRDEAWNSLSHVTHRRMLTFATQEGSKCLEGKLHSVSDKAITIKTKGGDMVSIPSAELVRVMDGFSARDILYSSRSSWADVGELKGINERSPEYVRIITITGKTHKGKISGVTDSEVTLKDGEHVTTVSKSNVARVIYVRLKPVSDAAQYDAQERVYLNPELWPYLLKIGPTMDVTVYDSSIPEYTGLASCNRAPRKQR